MGRGFAIAAGSRAAAEAGAEALRAGGTAVDAVVAAALAACVAEPAAAGLMGGAVLMLRPGGGGGAPRALDGFVHAPRRAPSARDLDLREAVVDDGDGPATVAVGAGTVATPGLGPALAEAHARHGRIPLADLARPAIEAARRGFALEPFQSRALKRAEAVARTSAALRALWWGGADAPPDAGATLRNPDLADVIETFAAEGPRFLSEGEPAAALAALCAERGGAVTRDDLRLWRPDWRAPAEARRGAARLWLSPPPAAGGASAGLCLGALDADPTPAAVADALAAVLRATEDDAPDRPGAPAFRAALRDARDGRPAVPRGGTHVSAVDAEGSAAALSLSNGDGCGLVLPGCGIAPNNLLGGGGRDPGSWTPDVRAASPLGPALVEWPDGAVAALGGGGGDRIAPALAQTLLRLIDGRAPIEDAVAAPRLLVRRDGRDLRLSVEDGFAEAARAGLRTAWPEAETAPGGGPAFGAVHAALREGRGATRACGDDRRGGAAVVG
jgi:gamma-glutamyltranspeptidase/glutathione hydrolase